jgi:molecular chaperone IbpA
MQLVRLDTNALNKMLIGFDRMFEDMETRWANSAQTNYPPHNVLKTGENTYEIQLAVSGFEKSEITVEVDQNQLIIRGERLREEDDQTVYLHRGLATRDFQKIFPLADHVEVCSSSIKNGILSIHLERIIPESLKPRRIEIVGE